jgi:hypothetical protein
LAADDADQSTLITAVVLSAIIRAGIRVISGPLLS